MKRFTVAVWLALLPAPMLLGAGRSLTLATERQQAVETAPRSVLTFPCRVRNLSSERCTLQPEVALPAGWSLVVPVVPFTLEPRQSEVKLFSVFVPGAAAAGDYSIEYRLQDRAAPTERYSLSFRVTVLPRLELQASVVEAPTFAIAGQRYRVVFRVLSASNTRNELTVAVESDPRLEHQTEPASLTLEPGQSELITVSFTGSAELPRECKQRVSLFLRGRVDGTLRAEAHCLIDLFPRTSRGPDLYRRLPGQLTLRAITENGKSAFQSEVSGRGALDQAGRENLEYLFRGPSTWAESTLGQYDEARVSLWNDIYELHLGDRTYALSPLTESGLYGRGVEARVKLPAFEGAAYHMETRWDEPGETQTGARLSYAPEPDRRLSLNLLEKSEGGAGSGLGSLHGELDPWDWLRTEGEVATGEGGATAYLAGVRGDAERFSYQLRHIHAAPGFNGYYRDTEATQAGIRVSPTPRVSYHASAQQERRNLARDPEVKTEAFEFYLLAGADVQVSRSATVGLSGSQRRYQDLASPPAFDRTDRLLRLHYADTFQDVGTYAAAESGVRDDRLQDERSPLHRGFLSLHYSASRRCSLGLDLLYENEGGVDGGRRESLATGLSSVVSITDRSALNLAVRRRTDLSGATRGDETSVDGGLSHTFTGGNSLRLFSRYTTGVGGSTTAALFEFTVPFGLPLGRDRQLGSVRGRVYDERTGAPVEDAILRLQGNTAVSDARGHYRFPAMTPVPAHLVLDPASLPLNRVPVEPMPRSLEVKGGADTIVDIGVTEGTTVAGRIAEFGYEPAANGLAPAPPTAPTPAAADTGISSAASQGTLVEKRPLPSVLVELRGTTETLRRVTDTKGRFAFERVRPGSWMLHVEEEAVGTGYYLEPQDVRLDLGPGERSEHLFRVLPKQRRVRIIERGGTLSEERP